MISCNTKNSFRLLLSIIILIANSVISLHALTLTDNAVSPEQFGALGDGIHDDTNAIQKAIATGKDLKLDAKTYIISRTLLIDVDKQSIIGVDGKSRIKCSENFTGDFCIKILNSSNNYFSRVHRIRRISGFCLDGSKKINGILIGPIDKYYDNHVDGLLFENVYIEYTKTALTLGNHFYKNTFINCVIRENEYSIRSCEGQYDCGESNVFYGCAFFDGGKGIDVSCSLNFDCCTFHVPIVISKCLLNIQNCHFERTHGNSTISQPLFVAKNNARMIISGGDAVISNNGVWTCKDAVLIADETSSIKVVDADWNYFLRGVTTDKKQSLTQGDVVIVGTKMPYKYERPIDASKIYQYTKENSFISHGFFGKDDLIYKAYNGGNKNFAIITELQNGDVHIKLGAHKSNNSNVSWIGKVIPIPTGHRTVWVQEGIRLLKTNKKNSYSLNFQTESKEFFGLVFLDRDRQIITTTDNKQFYKNIQSPYSKDQDFVINCQMSIPPQAEYVVLGASFLINDYSPDFQIEFDITRYCVEFL